MNLLNFDWLGYAESPLEAARILKDTGVFYLAVAVAYLLSFLYMLWHSPSTQRRRTSHCFGILLWVAVGSLLLLSPSNFGIFINTLVFLLSLLVIYQLQFTSAILAQSTLSVQKINTDDKKAMYASTLLSKFNFGIAEVLSYTLINEQILWFLILYRSAISVRASFGLSS